MESRRQKVREDPQTILQRHSGSSNSINAEPIPIDLIIEILWRLPTKSIARCRCVSKLWASLLRRLDFTELFLTRSSARPLLLFVCQNPSELSFFSTPQRQNLDENSSPIITPNYHMSFHCDHVYDIFSPISGLVCFRDYRIPKGRKNPVNVWVVCNPSTGQSFNLPKTKTRKRSTAVRSFFGYDPIDKQCKVLAMTSAHNIDHAVSKEHRVLTLGGTDEKPSWRMIDCSIPHCPRGDGICINGVLYYKASFNHFFENDMIVCFDVRAENFSVIKVINRVVHPRTTLINYNGKLGSLVYLGSNCISGTSKKFEMWVLEDLEKQEWSKHICELPLWLNVIEDTILYFVGMTDTNEIVLSPLQYPFDSFYVFYYSVEKKAIRRVEIQELEAFKGKKVYLFLNHVEDVKLMKVF